MNLPFTPDQFFEVMTKYNTSIWPAQVIIYALAALAFYLALRPNKYSNRIVSFILAVFWLWMGVMYHWAFFTAINPAAKLFGALFVLQGLIFIFAGVYKNQLVFAAVKGWYYGLGIFLAVFGAILYPLLGYFMGRAYFTSPTFGLPCPTTIFTMGILLMATRVPKYAAVIPFLWSLLGFTAALALGVKEDISLLIAGVLAFALISFRRKPAPIQIPLVQTPS